MCAIVPDMPRKCKCRNPVNTLTNKQLAGMTVHTWLALSMFYVEHLTTSVTVRPSVSLSVSLSATLYYRQYSTDRTALILYVPPALVGWWANVKDVGTTSSQRWVNVYNLRVCCSTINYGYLTKCCNRIISCEGKKMRIYSHISCELIRIKLIIINHFCKFSMMNPPGKFPVKVVTLEKMQYFISNNWWFWTRGAIFAALQTVSEPRGTVEWVWIACYWLSLLAFSCEVLDGSQLNLNESVSYFCIHCLPCSGFYWGAPSWALLTLSKLAFSVAEN